MAEIIELEDQIEKVILVGVSEQGGDDAEDSVAELSYREVCISFNIRPYS